MSKVEEPGELASSSSARSVAPLERAAFGSFAGREVEVYTLRNRHGLAVKVATFGAIVTELHVPDRQGRLADVVLGHDTLDGYVRDKAFLGAIVGRCANRIRDARFSLEGSTYELLANDSPHHLHGGGGWHKKIWSAEAAVTPRGPSVEMTYVSPDGEDNYPGTVDARVRFTLTDEDELSVEMRATTDRTTVVNLAHHGYFNLAGEAFATVHGHEVELRAHHYTPGDPVVPVGRVVNVSGTPFDFTRGKTLASGFAQLGEKDGTGGVPGVPKGFDHNFVVDGEPGTLREVARVREPVSGRQMLVSANQPGVQLYTGQFLDGTRGKAGRIYGPHGGFCLETQAFPAAINVETWRPQAILKAGAQYRHDMLLTFSAA